MRAAVHAGEALMTHEIRAVRPAPSTNLGMGVDVRRLRYFVAVAEENHFGRASLRLHIAQPALSRQIAQLEDAIGVELFDRTRLQIRLTAAGEALLPRARVILQSIADAVRVAQRTAAGTTGVLQIGFVGSATYSILPRLLHQFRSNYPDVDLVLHSMNTAELGVAVVERRIDVAFARPRIDDPEVVNELLLTEPVIVAMPKDDPLTSQPSIALDALADRPFVLYPRQPRPSFADRILQICYTAGFSPVIAQETQDLQTALGLVAVGAGVSLVPISVENSHREGVVYRPLSGDPPTTELSLSYRRDNGSAVLARFRSEILEGVKARAAF